MKKSYVTNKHFRGVLNQLGDVLENGEQPPEDLFAEFVNELKFSNLLIPGIINGDELEYQYITYDDGAIILPLYTDDEEYVKDQNIDGGYNPVPYDILYYKDALNENGLDGIIINPASECFNIPIDLLNQFPLNSGITFKDNFNGEGYNPEQLKNIAENTTNDSLVNFIRNPENKENFEGLISELFKATLLNVFVSDENFENFANNGIISLYDVNKFQLVTIAEDNLETLILFTNKNYIFEGAPEKGKMFYAYQITVLSKIIEIVLREDMDGILINPNLENYLIPRHALFNFSSILDNPKFKQAFDYAFLE